SEGLPGQCTSCGRLRWIIRYCHCRRPLESTHHLQRPPCYPALLLSRQAGRLLFCTGGQGDIRGTGLGYRIFAVRVGYIPCPGILPRRNHPLRWSSLPGACEPRCDQRENIRTLDLPVLAASLRTRECVSLTPKGGGGPV